MENILIIDWDKYFIIEVDKIFNSKVLDYEKQINNARNKHVLQLGTVSFTLMANKYKAKNEFYERLISTFTNCFLLNNQNPISETLQSVDKLRNDYFYFLNLKIGISEYRLRQSKLPIPYLLNILSPKRKDENVNLINLTDERDNIGNTIKESNQKDFVNYLVEYTAIQKFTYYLEDRTKEFTKIPKEELQKSIRRPFQNIEPEKIILQNLHFTLKIETKNKIRSKPKAIRESTRKKYEDYISHYYSLKKNGDKEDLAVSKTMKKYKISQATFERAFKHIKP